MHIPDGYLSPATSAVAFAGVAPVWIIASRKAKRTLRSAAAPRLGLFAAFAFVLMMFNVPLPGGTSGHAVGGALMAIALGPWEAVLGLSAALAIQALFFGDGGITALGANCFNMAVVLPFVSYGVFRLMRRSGVGEPWSAGIGGWIGMVAAAACVGVELGIQPLLFHTAQGVPLYCPYGLKTTVSMMVISHALVAGPVEGLVAALVLGYIRKAQPDLVRPDAPIRANKLRPVWIALVAAALLTPLGLLAHSSAFGEWDAGELLRRVGFVPRGLAHMQASRPAAPLAGYGAPGLSERPGYVVAALVGIALVFAAAWLVAAAARRGGGPPLESTCSNDAPTV